MKLELELPAHPLTAEDFERLPEVDGIRMELWEGSLVVAAAAQVRWHSMVARRIDIWFRDQGRDAEREVGVVLAPREVRAPDVVVFKTPSVDLMRSQFPAADIACVVEVVSPESEKRDRLAKPRDYAAAGIGEFWLVEQHPGDSFDAVIKQFALTVAADRSGYTLVRTLTLTELEKEGQ